MTTQGKDNSEHRIVTINEILSNLELSLDQIDAFDIGELSDGKHLYFPTSQPLANRDHTNPIRLDDVLELIETGEILPDNVLLFSEFMSHIMPLISRDWYRTPWDERNSFHRLYDDSTPAYALDVINPKFDR